MSDVQIDAIEKQLQAALDDGRLLLSSAFLTSAGLPDLPAWLLPAAATLTAATLKRIADSHLHIGGELASESLGNVAVAIDIHDGATGVTAALAVKLRTSLSFAKLMLASDLPSVPGLANFLGAEAISAIGTLQTADGLQLELTLSGTQQIHLGPIQIRVVLNNAAVTLVPLGLASLSGKLYFGGLTFAVKLPAGPDTRLEATAPGLTVEKLIEALGIKLPPLPALNLLTQPLDGVSIETFNGVMCLGALSSIPGLGMLSLSAALGDAGLGFVLALQTAPTFKLSALSPVLAPFDLLLSVLTFGTPALVLSTVTSPSFAVYDSTGNWRTVAVETGVQINGLLQLKGFGLDALRMLTGTDHLPFAFPLAPDLTDLHILVDLRQEIALLPSVLTVDHFKLSLAPDPLAVDVSSTAHLTAFGQKFPDFILEAGLAPGVYHIGFATASPWKNPLGFPFTLDEVGLEIDGPVAEYGVFGKITLKETTASVAAKFAGDAPTFLAATLTGKLSFSILLDDLTGIDVPFPWEPVLSDASLYIVLNPLGETILTHFYPPGIGLSGTISILWLSASMMLSATPSHITASASLGAPIVIPPLLEVTGFGGTSVPSFTIDTTHSPVAWLSARVAMLGLSQDILGVIEAGGISFTLNDAVGPVTASLSGKLGKDEFAASGTVSCGVKGSIGPLTAAGVQIGSVALDVHLNVICDIAGDSSGKASVSVTASFAVAGITIGIPATVVSLKTLADLPGALLEYLQQHAEELFKDFTTDVAAWLRAAADGLITGVDNAAKSLMNGFTKDINYTASALVTNLRQDVNTATNLLYQAGQSAAAIASAMADIRRAPSEIRAALTALVLPAAEIAAAMHAAFPGIPHADTAAIPHLDVAATLHADAAAVHADVGASHTNLSTGHVDTATGHTNGTTGHTNFGGGWVPHVDVGGIHTDIGGVHTDYGGVHTDFGTAHIDNVITPHVDVAPKAHIDTPSAIHIDTP